MITDVAICNIFCNCKEYHLINSDWVLFTECTYNSNSGFINNMVTSSRYFAKCGGIMDIEYNKNRRFGLVPTRIISVSVCKTIKKVYMFNYNQAQVY